MKLDAILTRAVRFARRGKYDEAIKTLEVEVNRYHGSPTYYYLLGVSYLYSNIYGSAITYFKLAAEKRKRDPQILLGLAALYLNHGDTDKAIDIYLEVQTIDASNKIAKKALKIIRRHPAPEEISAWIDSGMLHTLYPPIPKADAARSGIALGGLAAAAGVILALGISFQAGLLFWPGANQRPLPAEFELSREERDAPLQAGAAYRFILTGNQVLETFEEARRLFLARRDEAARVSFNRILESNASEPIKNRARLLISYLELPGFDTIHRDDRFTYTEVIQAPFLFRDAHVIWRGTVSHLEVGHNHTTFDFLVGNEVRRLEGIVQVDFNFATAINQERPLEILGRVIPVYGERGIRIQGIDFHQAAHLGNP